VAGVPLPGLGANNRACQFNGSAGHVNVPAAFLNYTNTLTVTAWVQASPANGLLQCILGKGDSSYRLEIDGNGFPHFADGQDNSVVSGPNRIDDGRWHQLVGIYDNLGTNYLYVDGALASITNAQTSPAGSSYDLRLGGAPDFGTSRNFSGVIDEVALFTNALSSVQIQQLYLTATNPAVLTPLPPLVEASVQEIHSLSCTWNAVQGLRYQLQYGTNLVQSAWLNLGTFITATDTVISVSTPIGPDPKRFYRTILLP
jgi:hypothetical protein